MFLKLYDYIEKASKYSKNITSYSRLFLNAFLTSRLLLKTTMLLVSMSNFVKVYCSGSMSIVFFVVIFVSNLEYG